jgi:ribosomal protein S1
MATPDITPSIALEPKTKLNGKVLKTTLAGALVDIGQTIPGVIHISQLSDKEINKVEDVVKEGQEVTTWVKRVRKDRVELTMIEPLMYDWKELKPEMIVKGKVIRLETYGAFVEFGAERPGLVHVSEITHGYVKTAAEALKEGEEIEAKVLEVDRRKRQIRLSIKALLAEPVIEEKPEREDRKSKGKGRGKKAEETYEMEEEVSNEPQFTGMQIAWLQAQEKAKGKNKIRRKSFKSASEQQEQLLNSTLEKRMPTGG